MDLKGDPAAGPSDVEELSFHRGRLRLLGQGGEPLTCECNAHLLIAVAMGTEPVHLPTGTALSAPCRWPRTAGCSRTTAHGCCAAKAAGHAKGPSTFPWEIWKALVRHLWRPTFTKLNAIPHAPPTVDPAPNETVYVNRLRDPAHSRLTQHPQTPSGRRNSGHHPRCRQARRRLPGHRLPGCQRAGGLLGRDPGTRRDRGQEPQLRNGLPRPGPQDPADLRDRAACTDGVGRLGLPGHAGR